MTQHTDVTVLNTAQPTSSDRFQATSKHFDTPSTSPPTSDTQQGNKNLLKNRRCLRLGSLQRSAVGVVCLCVVLVVVVSLLLSEMTSKEIGNTLRCGNFRIRNTFDLLIYQSIGLLPNVYIFHFLFLDTLYCLSVC